MFDILSIVPGNKKLTPSGWYTFNAVCCGHFGHRQDKRRRGGIKLEGQTGWTYHCFNCNFSCGFMLGKPISHKTKQLLSWSGIDQDQIQRWNIESLQQRDLLDILYPEKKSHMVSFQSAALPKHIAEINLSDDSRFATYLKNRRVTDYSYYQFTKPTGRDKDGILIPFTYKGKTVGHAIRYLDDRTPKYISHSQPGYVFGYDFQNSAWSSCILTEGFFDAISISGCALMHNAINDDQAKMLSRLNKPIIMVPDQDEAGLRICDQALSLGYKVSIPEWGHGIKDVNDAVVRYGKLQTIISILDAATHSKIKVEMRKKHAGK